MNSTPVASLLIEAAEWPLPLRFDLLTDRLLLRWRSRPTHPTYTALLQLTPNGVLHPRLRQRPLSSSGGSSPPPPPRIPLTCRRTGPAIIFHTGGGPPLSSPLSPGTTNPPLKLESTRSPTRPPSSSRRWWPYRRALHHAAAAGIPRLVLLTDSMSALRAIANPRPTALTPQPRRRCQGGMPLPPARRQAGRPGLGACPPRRPAKRGRRRRRSPGPPGRRAHPRPRATHLRIRGLQEDAGSRLGRSLAPAHKRPPPLPPPTYAIVLPLVRRRSRPAQTHCSSLPSTPDPQPPAAPHLPHFRHSTYLPPLRPPRSYSPPHAQDCLFIDLAFFLDHLQQHNLPDTFPHYLKLPLPCLHAFSLKRRLLLLLRRA
ncbi:hypothetical protein ONE63_001698 [Megalurothrips usitatus]|uniref:Uncharacterized protein n=1 Tax=Megalurothrips usitatus TaxID=439358 RepID=A0AAV7XBH0_9NEOP|nr:hypothetical protein ONE63_001698 [Megalurothrips usitatus]